MRQVLPLTPYRATSCRRQSTYGRRRGSNSVPGRVPLARRSCKRCAAGAPAFLPPRCSSPDTACATCACLPACPWSALPAGEQGWARQVAAAQPSVSRPRLCLCPLAVLPERGQGGGRTVHVTVPWRALPTRSWRRVRSGWSWRCTTALPTRACSMLTSLKRWRGGAGGGRWVLGPEAGGLP